MTSFAELEVKAKEENYTSLNKTVECSVAQLSNRIIYEVN